MEGEASPPSNCGWIYLVPFRLLLSLTGVVDGKAKWSSEGDVESSTAWTAARHSWSRSVWIFCTVRSVNRLNVFIIFLLFSFLGCEKQAKMDRVKSSMQQVPNAIPKVIRRTGGANSLELEKENFERGQVGSDTSCHNAVLVESVGLTRLAGIYTRRMIVVPGCF